MRGIYLTLNNTNDINSGVCKKIISQVKILNNNGINTEIVDSNTIDVIKTSVIYDNIRALVGYNNPNWYRLYEVVKKKLANNNYDVIYVRKSFLDSHSVRFFKFIKKNYPNIKLLFEIPTYPYDAEIRLSQRLMLYWDKKYRTCFHEFADRIISYSNDKIIFGVQTINISNAIDYSKFKIRTPKSHEGINVVAVALFERWHGYDRFLEGMYNQPDVVKSNNIHLWLAGKGKILSTYKKDVRTHGLQDYVHFLGEVHGDALDNLYNIADIALDCMGRHRVGCYYNSSLKGKEYCAYGVPIISGVETELDCKKEFQYYLRVPSDDTKLDMNTIVDFYNMCYNDTTPWQLAETIRYSTYNWFNFDFAFKPIIDFIKDK